MSHSGPLAAIGDFDADAHPGLYSPASPALPCTIKQLHSSLKAPSPSLSYCPSDSGWTFADPCAARRPILFRNAVAHAGEFFEVRSLSSGALRCCLISAVCISRTVARLGEGCLGNCFSLEFVVFEADSFLCEIESSAFSLCQSLLSIAIPSSVRLLGVDSFAFCLSLRSVMFERSSRLATIKHGGFWTCQSLKRLLIPASVTVIDD
jgi:hypothetical protein